jgi:hypothetical protein
MNRSTTGFLVAALVLTSAAERAFGQASDAGGTTPSLGEVAKKSKGAAGSKAKVVIDDDNLKRLRGPIPAIAFEGVDNSDDIIKAVRDCRKSHTAAETEEAVRGWYDEFDSELAHALEDNARLVVRKEDRRLREITRDYYDDGDYSKAQQRRDDEIRSDRDDFRRSRDNGFTIARIQQTFIKVRSDLQKDNLRYAWFKIRNANGVGSF